MASRSAGSTRRWATRAVEREHPTVWRGCASCHEVALNRPVMNAKRRADSSCRHADFTQPRAQAAPHVPALHRSIALAELGDDVRVPVRVAEHLVGSTIPCRQQVCDEAVQSVTDAVGQFPRLVGRLLAMLDIPGHCETSPGRTRSNQVDVCKVDEQVPAGSAEGGQVATSDPPADGARVSADLVREDGDRHELAAWRSGTGGRQRGPPERARAPTSLRYRPTERPDPSAGSKSPALPRGNGCYDLPRSMTPNSRSTANPGFGSSPGHGLNLPRSTSL
jgi:hypothetical protein